MQMLDVKANKPVPLPPQLARISKQVAEEEPLLASILEEPPIASVVAEPSQKKSIWLSLPVLLGIPVSIGFLFVLCAGVLITGESNSDTSRSLALPSDLISPDTDRWLAVNTEAHWFPSENATVVGKMNRGAVVTVAKDDGSGWVEVHGFAAAIYKSSSWIRYPDEFLDIQQNVFIRKKHLTPSHPGY